MISNYSLREMGNLLRSAESIVIFPHESPDGDALGSCAALVPRSEGMRGRTAWVLLDEPVSGYLGFHGYGILHDRHRLREYAGYLHMCRLQ